MQSQSLAALEYNEIFAYSVPLAERGTEGNSSEH